MCEDPTQAERRSMVSTGTHESQDLMVPSHSPAPDREPSSPGSAAASESGAPPGPGAAAALDADKVGHGPVNAITVLTLLDKLVNMLDTVQENQHKMEVRQAEMEGAVRGIQVDMTKLSKSHTHTSNTVSKLLDKSRKVSVTMKEVRDRMERQATQVKKLEANHAHLLQRNNFKVLIFQEENEIPSSVFVREPVPYPRDTEDLAPPPAGGDHPEEEGLHAVDLSSDEEAGLDAELEEEGEVLMDLEHMEKSRAEKIKRSSLKKVDSLKKAFSRQNIEKKMNKIGTKIVSQEQRDKIKKSLTPHSPKSPGDKTSAFKISPLTFSIRKSRSGSESKPVAAEPQALAPDTSAPVELSPLTGPDADLPFHEVHSLLAPEALETEGGGGGGGGGGEEEEESHGPPEEQADEEGLSEEYALSATLPQDSSCSSPPGQEEEQEEEEEEEEEEKGVEEEREVEVEEKEVEVEREVEEEAEVEKGAEEEREVEVEKEVEREVEVEAEEVEAEVEKGVEEEREAEVEREEKREVEKEEEEQCAQGVAS